MIRRRSTHLFLLALLVRLIHLAQIRSGPTFDVPLVDGANYFRTASAIASGDLLGGSQAFWQPPLYPYFLALLLRIFGPSMTAIYVVQAAIGALSCLLVYFLGRRLFDERSGLAASIIMALYGPLIHFDAQPLIPVLHIVLLLGGLLFIVRAAGIPEAASSPGREWGLAGLLWGLAVVATPNLLLAVPPIALWGLKRARRPAVPLLFLLGVGLPIAAVTARNLAVSGEAVLISSNGGINFYIGNNPDYDRTIRIRPGGEFERLASEPENLGILGAAARSRYFVSRARDFLAGYPGAAVRLYLRKGLDLLPAKLREAVVLRSPSRNDFHFCGGAWEGFCVRGGAAENFAGDGAAEDFLRDGAAENFRAGGAVPVRRRSPPAPGPRFFTTAKELFAGGAAIRPGLALRKASTSLMVSSRYSPG